MKGFCLVAVVVAMLMFYQKDNPYDFKVNVTAIKLAIIYRFGVKQRWSCL